MSREMKDSGLDWVGSIPSNWSIDKNKRLFVEVNERCENGENYTLLSVSEYYGIAPKIDKIEDGEFETHAETLDGYKICKKDDIIMNIMLAWKRATGRSSYDGIVSPAYCVYRRLANIDTRYYHYLYRTDACADMFKRFSTGIIDSRLRLYPDVFLSLFTIVPPIEEQTRIASFLDLKCAEIDAVIAKTQATIEEYKALKQSIITEAVTKGVRGERPMKDSGIEWIGEIPEEWSIVKITRVLDYTSNYPIGDGDHGLVSPTDYCENGIPYIRVQNLGYGTQISTEGLVYISEETNNKIINSSLHPNDVLFAKTGATIGKTGIIPIDMPLANTTSHVGKLTISPIYNAKWIQLVLSSNIGYRQFWEIALQKTTRPELSIDEIRSMKVILPPKDEQDEIVNFIETKSSELDSLIQSKNRLLVELDSYKKSVIYEYVTGKKEVPWDN